MTDLKNYTGKPTISVDGIVIPHNVAKNSNELLEALKNLVDQVTGCEIDCAQAMAVKKAKEVINKTLEG